MLVFGFFIVNIMFSILDVTCPLNHIGALTVTKATQHD